MSEKSIEQILKEALAQNFQPSSPLNAETETIRTDSDINNDHDGTVSVCSGKVLVRPPAGKGKYPTVSSGPNVRIFANNIEQNGLIILTEDTHIKIVLNDSTPEVEYDIAFSKDKVEAYVNLHVKKGKRYQLANQNESRHLTLHAEAVEELLPSLNITEIKGKLTSLGIKVRVDLSLLEKEIQNLSGNKTVLVARGVAPVPSKDAYIEYLFDMNERIHKTISEEDRVDFFDQGNFQSVEVGSVLAIKHVEVPGKAGLSVIGTVIPVSPPSNININAGSGVCLADNDTKAVATISGRPLLLGHNALLSVLSQLVIPGDVDISTGNIDFKGDVLVRGNVLEGLSVSATGRVIVLGNVYSKIFSGDSIVVGQNLVGGMLSAGGSASFYTRIHQIVSQLSKHLKDLYKAINHLKSNPMFCVKDLNLKGEGNLVKLLLDIKFKEIPKLIEMVNQYVKSVAYTPEQSILNCFNLLTVKLTGLGPLSIKSFEELLKLDDMLTEVIRTGDEMVVKSASVKVKYTQNAVIEATGSVYVLGSGCYHSNIYSGEEIKITGVCRGGELKSLGDISINHLGSPAGVETRVETSNGNITANAVFPNSVLKVGASSFKSDNVMKFIHCYLDNDNKLAIKIKNQ